MTSVIHKEGFLVKAPMSVGTKHTSIFSGHKKSQKRFFVLEGQNLSYFESAGKGKEKGSLTLGSETIIKQVNATGLVVIPYPGSKKELYVSARDEKEGKEWSEALAEACKISGGGSDDVEEKKDASDNDSDWSDSDQEEEDQEKQDVETQPKVEEFPDLPAWKREWIHRIYGKTKLHIAEREYELLKTGSLEKQSKALDGHWNKRYFVLDNNLKYYSTEEAYTQNEGVTEIPLESIIAVRTPNEAHFEMLVRTIGGNHLLRCETEEELVDWLDKLNNVDKYLQPVTRVVYKGADVSRKQTPDFLVEVQEKKRQAAEERRLSLLAQGEGPPPGHDDNDDAEVEAPYQEEEEEAASPPTPPQEAQESAPSMEDKFAKLRALKAKRQ